jgi:hypothetical protein
VQPLNVLLNAPVVNPVLYLNKSTGILVKPVQPRNVCVNALVVSGVAEYQNKFSGMVVRLVQLKNVLLKQLPPPAARVRGIAEVAMSRLGFVVATAILQLPVPVITILYVPIAE